MRLLGTSTILKVPTTSQIDICPFSEPSSVSSPKDGDTPMFEIRRGAPCEVLFTRTTGLVSVRLRARVSICQYGTDQNQPSLEVTRYKRIKREHEARYANPQSHPRTWVTSYKHLRLQGRNLVAHGLKRLLTIDHRSRRHCLAVASAKMIIPSYTTSFKKTCQSLIINQIPEVFSRHSSSP